jgi:hypothetical protein
MDLLGWFLNIFKIIFTQKIQRMDFFNYFNFALISHRVTFHFELHVSSEEFTS